MASSKRVRKAYIQRQLKRLAAEWDRVERFRLSGSLPASVAVKVCAELDRQKKEMLDELNGLDE